MEPTPPAPALPEHADAPAGELVVQNGRLSGARRALRGPLTLIGREPGCEVRLNLDGVNPLHCAILHGPTGFVLRDLGSAGGTLLNGQTVSTCRLRHGDVITVGPFQFGVELHDPGAEEGADPDVLEAERGALRIQAAAVAAQQAALTEEEVRLQQRQTALERQEEQLADHLEERRQRLLRLQEEVRLERTTLKGERAAFRREQEGGRAEVGQARAAAVQQEKQARQQRQRLVSLRKRLRQRWRRHWHAHEVALRQGEEAVRKEARRLRAEAERLQAERANFLQAQRRFNGEVELGRRQLQEDWQELGLAQQQWEVCLNREQEERDRRGRVLDEREVDLQRRERALAAEKEVWHRAHANLEKEINGLEARVRNQRSLLQEQAQELARIETAQQGRPAEVLAAPAPSSPPAFTAEEKAEVPEVLQRLAGDLADQRWHLLEQWQRLVAFHDHWQQERLALHAELEVVALRQEEREQRLQAQEGVLAATAASLRQRQESLGELRCSLEAWQARLTTREVCWESERALLLADVQEREDAVARRVRHQDELRRRRGQVWRSGLEAVRRVRGQCDEARQQYLTLWEECRQRRAELLRDQRGLANQAVALERLRQEWLGRAANSVAAEKRLDRLRRQSAALTKAVDRELERDFQTLQAEGDRVEGQVRLVRQQEAELLARHEEWARQQAAWEEQSAAAEDAGHRDRQERRHLQVQHAQDERQLAALRDEVERLARLLMDDTGAGEPSTNQAA
jgi:pSer/pThr/pTyr-binding forkhead associated (FHA) protein